MNSEDINTVEPPTSIDPYAMLSVPTTAVNSEIKSAYRKLALRIHPDKVSPEKREAAHVKFQELTFAYAILIDSKRRARYDRTGSTAETLEDEDGFDWADFFRAQYAEHITTDKINELKRTYQGSSEERRDVLKAFKQGRGNLDKVFEEVMLSSVLDDEERIRAYIEEAIKDSEVEAFPNYIRESEKKKEARRERARKELVEAEEASREIGVHEEIFGAGKERTPTSSIPRKEFSKPKSAKKSATGSQADLAAIIQQRQMGRANAFFDKLEAKYAGVSKQTKRKVNEPSEEAFAAMAKRGRSSKESKALEGDDEEDMEISRSSRSKRNRAKP